MIPHKQKVTEVTATESIIKERYPIQVEYLEARVNYWNWMFEIRRRTEIVNFEARFEIEVFNKCFWSGSVFLHKDRNGNDLIIPTMESALKEIEKFITNEIK